MTIDEAIRYNAVTLGEMERQLLHHRASALRQSIGALKRVKAKRLHFEVDINRLLPGETKD